MFPFLGHPGIKVFITHGGLFSTVETTYHGVPVIGLPLCLDQGMNMEKTVMLGAGVMLKWKYLTVETLTNAIQDIIQNKR